MGMAGTRVRDASPAGMAAVERTQLGGDGFTIARLVTGLWQIADMEKDGEEVDLGPAATDMREYAEAGLDTFDMADHCSPPPPDPPPSRHAATRVRSRALDRLVSPLSPSLSVLPPPLPPRCRRRRRRHNHSHEPQPQRQPRADERAGHAQMAAPSSSRGVSCPSMPTVWIQPSSPSGARSPVR